ncbi:murein biosynthesis integral membrane protein MurJ, partial [Rickettsiales bacterium]|nr:murein biosynthesis integral membrane protein MurJ [Rickettsiales bacterium]
MSLMKSAFTVGSFTLISRIFGYIRDILIASHLGAGFLADAFFVAFRLPNLFRQLSAEGAFSNAFIPMFAGKLEKEGQKHALEFAGHILSLMLIILSALTIFMILFMPAIMHVLAPGFVDNPEQFATIVQFGRIIFVYIIFISVSALLGGILNSMGRFAAFASVPIIFNVILILTLIFHGGITQNAAISLIWGVVIAGIFQLSWMMIFMIRANVRLKLKKPKIYDDVKTLMRRMVPGLIGGGVTQANLWINTIIATFMPGAVSYLYYADRLVQFPLAIIGTAIGTALLPLLSKQIKSGGADAIKTQNQALSAVLLLSIPAAFALITISEPLIRIMFERGQFSALETTATAKALMAYSLGLPAFMLIKIFAPNFFARGDTKTPLKIAIICLFANVILSISLMQIIGHVGMAIATSLSSWLNASLLIFILIKKGL